MTGKATFRRRCFWRVGWSTATLPRVTDVAVGYRGGDL